MTKWIFLKVAGFLAAVSALLLVGYSAGLHVQHVRECRFRAYCNLYDLVPRHKELSSGDYDREYRLKCVAEDIGRSVRYTHYETTWDDCPRLLRGADAWDLEWQEKAIAVAAGFHRDRPDIKLPPDVQKELENFVPSDEFVRGAMNLYACHRTRH